MSNKSLAIITGASRGIGKAAAQLFLNEGWDVYNLSRKACDLTGVTNHELDLLDTDKIRESLKKLDLSGYEKITLVHNAGITRKDTYETATDDDMLDVFKVNVLAPQIINQTLTPHMPEGSSIIFIGSTLSEIGVPNSLSYTVSKHGIAGLMKSTVQDLAGKNIHGCLICPGFTDTTMLKDEVFDSNPEMIDMAKSMVLMGRLVNPEEIASLIYFCAKNPAINGSVLHANLGQK